MPQECTEHLQALFGSMYSHLSSTEQIILGTAYLEGAVTNSRMQSMLDMHSTDIGRILSGLVDAKMLIANKKGRWTDYQINESYDIVPEQVQIADFSPLELTFNTDTDKAIYEYIRTNGFITSHQILEITRITTTQGANVALGRLMKMGLVKKIRKGRQFIYQLTN